MTLHNLDNPAFPYRCAVLDVDQGLLYKTSVLSSHDSADCTQRVFPMQAWNESRHACT